jgi:hypothetical protein
MSNSGAAKILDYLQPRLNRRSVAFLLCLLLSSLFWLLISLSKEYTDEINIPVVYENVPENLLIANIPEEAVSAEVRGFGFDLLWHMMDLETVKIRVSANPASLPSLKRNGEEYHYLLSSERTGKLSNIGDDQLEVLRIWPDTLFVKFKPLYSKKVPVDLDADITFEKQFGSINQPVIEPDSVTLIGPEEEVNKISMIVTEKQSWSDLDESLTEEVNLILSDQSSLVKFSSEKVQVTVTVVEFTEGSVTIPLEVNAPNASSVKVFPSQVEVRYQVPLSEYDNMHEGMFKASVTLGDKDETMLAVNLDEYPAKVKQLRIIPSQVEYIIQQ